jgi:hypothetical protein
MIKHFISSLKRPLGRDVFNPWFEWDGAYDIGPEAPVIRRTHLEQYLTERKQASCLLVGEALGYQGGRFTGIPMTSERILLNKTVHKGIQAHHVLRGIVPKRTSQTIIKRNGFVEPTATIIWEQVIRSGVDTRALIFWNAFPWHPYNPILGLLSNRTPTHKEIEAGKAALLTLLASISVRKIIAVGEKAYHQLNAMGLEISKVRHPSHGGAALFRRPFRHEMSL